MSKSTLLFPSCVIILNCSQVEKAIELFGAEKNRDLLSQAFVVGATCYSCITGVYKRDQHIEFPIVILDECSQMTEPTSILPLSHFCTRRALLIGDPEQLQPTLPRAAISHRGGGHGLERTAFERISAMITPILLREQYRCHPDISAVSNRLFYRGMLRDGIRAENHPSILSLPNVIYVDTKASNEAYMNKSVMNVIEAKVLVSVLQALKQCDSSLDIGVVSLYKSQVSQIRAELNSATLSCSPDSILVSTVDAFQGGERDVILLSTVRTSLASGSFFEDRRRINVALTRAKRVLVVFGHGQVLRKSNLWSKVIETFTALTKEEILHKLRQ
jgi:superfamily I DNA and/or RNA helicase